MYQADDSGYREVQLPDEKEGEPAYLRPMRERRPHEAIPLLRDAIERDDGLAMGYYATLLFKGVGIERDRKEAVAWFRLGAERGDLFSMLGLGACLAKGEGVRPCDLEASYWLYQGAKGGYSIAISMLSDVVGRNPGVVGHHFTLEEYQELMRFLRPAGTIH